MKPFPTFPTPEDYRGTAAALIGGVAEAVAATPPADRPALRAELQARAATLPAARTR